MIRNKPAKKNQPARAGSARGGAMPAPDTEHRPDEHRPEHHPRETEEQHRGRPPQPGHQRYARLVDDLCNFVH